MILLKILSQWYRTQEYVVKRGNVILSGFTVFNGLRQGELISPALFNVYTDHLNNLLTVAKVGCQIAGNCMNNLGYADDFMLMSPSVKALQQLQRICLKHARNFDIAFTPSKRNAWCSDHVRLLVITYGAQHLVTPRKGMYMKLRTWVTSIIIH